MRSFETSAHATFCACVPRWCAITDARGEIEQTGAALLERFLKASALAVAEACEFVDRFDEQRMRALEERRGISRRVAHDAGPAQHVDDVDVRGGTDLRRDRLGALAQRVKQGAVDFERRRGDRGPKAQRAVELAAPHGLRQQSAVFGFRCSKFLRQATPDLEEAVIDGLQFPGEHAPRELKLAPGEAGHATDHGRFAA